jgi:hypothetical protein
MEGVEMTTPSTISISRTPNSFIVSTGITETCRFADHTLPPTRQPTQHAHLCRTVPIAVAIGPNALPPSCTLALATSEPSKPRDVALPLRTTQKEFVRRGILCDTWRVYAGIKENTSGRAFGGSTGIDFGVYDSLQVPSESVAAGTGVCGSIQTRRISAQGNTRARRCTMYTEPASKEQRGSISRRSLFLGS